MLTTRELAPVVVLAVAWVDIDWALDPGPLPATERKERFDKQWPCDISTLQTLHAGLALPVKDSAQMLGSTRSHGFDQSMAILDRNWMS